MKILVAGATGKTGSRLVRELNDRGHEPIALVRESSDTSILPAQTVTRQADLTDLPEDVCADCDVAVFAAGSGGDTSAELTDKVDRDGAKSLIDMAKQSGVSRFVMLSTIGAGDPDPDSDLAHYLKAKHEADEHLKASGLEYAIIRPVSLTEKDGCGEILYGNDVETDGEAARGDVAIVLADAAEQDAWANQTKLMQSA